MRMHAYVAVGMPTKTAGPDCTHKDHEKVKVRSSTSMHVRVIENH